MCDPGRTGSSGSGSCGSSCSDRFRLVMAVDINSLALLCS